MNKRIAALATLVTIAGCRTVEPAPPPDAPKIGTFTASKSRVASGEQVTLSFTTTNATKVEISDDHGRQLELSGTIESGSATVAPTATSFYVLRATGAGGRDTAFVQVAVNEPLRELFLIAVPGSIESGQQAQLLWGAAGASAVTLTAGNGTPTTLMGTTGAVTVTPAASERYTLSAQGAPGTPPLTALADVQVRPVLVEATLTSLDGVGPGKTLTFRWRTGGAQRLVVTEQTFGQLTAVTDAASVVMGSFDFVIPNQLPSGIDVADGLPLRFTVTASADGVSQSKVLTAVVGDQPVIEFFNAPAAGTAAGNFTVSWRTLNATEISISVGALPVWGTLPAELARVADGNVSLPSPTVQTEYTFTARNDRGAFVSRLFTVRPVGRPVINTFTLTPTITNLGDSATAQWTTTDAVRVQLRHENGPNLRTITTASQVASGNVGLLLASSTRIVLEATNAAGDSVTETRAFTFSGAVTLTPNPVLRGSPATLTWDLAAANATEVVGLPTMMPAPIGGSNNFVDLVTSPTANEVTITDIADGAEKLTLPAGFRFPLLGVVQSDLWVSVNGFIATSNPGAASTNVDLSATNSAPTLIAPFWDDLTMTANSKIFVDTSTSVLGERFLIVQWEQVQIAGQQNSDLTFQVHLYESGQIAFIYKNVAGTLNSATIGVQDTGWPVAQQYAFDSTTTQPAPGMELNFFSGGPAAGMLTFNAGPSRRVNFAGRTTMSLVAASAELRSFGPGDVAITEAMPIPENSVLTTGQWLELRNNQAFTTDFEGLVVSTPGSLDGGFTFPPGSFVDAGAYVLIGQSTDMGLNGGAPVAFASDDVPLAVPGSATISLGAAPLAALAWDAGTAAQSIAPVTPVLVASGTFMCPRTATFGPGGALGTPGSLNENCAPYVLSSIPGNFIPAPMGTDIGASLSGDEGYLQVTLPVPFRYYGQTYNDFSFSMNGFITLGAPLAANQFTSPTTVSATVPNGVVSPLWDDLHRDTGRAAMFRLADRTVVSWQTFNTYDAFIFSEPSDLNFQVHLFDNGVIEFHYGTMSTTSTDAFVIGQTRGANATCWLETPMGDRAVPFSVHVNGLVQPNSGVRFTPAP